MKRAVTILVAAALVLGSAAASYGTGYSDIKVSNWAYGAVAAMSDKSIVKGYPDGSFKPGNTVTYGEFIKMALIADSGQDAGNASSGHWALNYYNKALEQNYFTNYDISKGQLSDSITRSDMALIISSILGDVKIENYDEIQKGIKDITYQTKHEYDITKAYASGILTGYTDSTFRPNQTLTRAESATVIYRLVDESKRELPGAEKQEDSAVTGKVKDFVKNYDSFINSGDGSINEDLAVAETYIIVTDASRYYMSLGENRGTKWIYIPDRTKIHKIYLMKDGKIVERPMQDSNADGSAVAIYKSDITKIDYIVSLHVSEKHMELIVNPFKK